MRVRDIDVVDRRVCMFMTGMGFTLFMYTWYHILMLVKLRLDQMTTKSVQKVRFYLKIACTSYFAIWTGCKCLNTRSFSLFFQL